MAQRRLILRPNGGGPRCPDCGGPIVHGGGRVCCPICGYSRRYAA